MSFHLIKDLEPFSGWDEKYSMEGSEDSTTVRVEPELECLFIGTNSFKSTEVSTITHRYISLHEPSQALVWSTTSTSAYSAYVAMPPWWGRGYITEFNAWLACTSTGTSIHNFVITPVYNGSFVSLSSEEYSVASSFFVASSDIAKFRIYEVASFQSTVTYLEAENLKFPVDLTKNPVGFFVSVDQDINSTSHTAQTRVFFYGASLKFKQDTGYVSPTDFFL